MPTIHAPHCFDCKVPLPQSAPRVFERPHWFCSDCIYKREVNPDAKTRPKIGKPKWPQKGKLWGDAA